MTREELDEIAGRKTRDIYINDVCVELAEITLAERDELVALAEIGMEAVEAVRTSDPVPSEVIAIEVYDAIAKRIDAYLARAEGKP